MAGRCFVATYRPLIQTAAGREAVRQHGLPPFIDGSCRREPDLESPFPSISATCRAGNFAPRLQEGDRVAYLTVKGKYGCDLEPGWRLVAILCIICRLPSHKEAAGWYLQRGCPIPSNCLVDGNPPKAYELTNQNPPSEIKERIRSKSDFGRAARCWDRLYCHRVTKWPVFLATQAEFRELTHPPQLRKTAIIEAFGRVPGTLNPPEVPCDRLELLIQLATGAEPAQR
jgi:hypothetical protein